MKKILLLFSVILIGSVLFGAMNAFAQKKMKKEAKVWPAGDIKWSEMKGGPPGVMIAPLWGDISKGAYGALIKFTAAMDNPLHTHSSDAKLVVISGSFWHASEGGEKKMLGPGSYFMLPGGVRHASGADAGTVVFQESSGKFDMKPVEMPKEKK